MKRFLLAAFLLFCMVGGAAVASAQVRGTGLGPKAGLYLDGSLFMAGAVMELPLTSNFDIEPGAELVFGISNTTRIVLDANGRYSFDIIGSDIRPYLAGGVGLVLDFVSLAGASASNSDFRLNLGAGVTFSTRSLVQPWVGLKLALLSAQSDVLVQGGVNFYF
jgi:opacity protein-like surface antigen